ncbi:hypothetical protein CBW52_04755 [Yersinia kristensenii]|uniref:Uncharacterized protein n=1 Tax=Yersinia kristensenii TaxID=28152 RepID=A0AB73Q6U3_YERKR|nr:hypothetical protein CBW52_04755 [Yersinia kristensenii]
MRGCKSLSTKIKQLLGQVVANRAKIGMLMGCKWFWCARIHTNSPNRGGIGEEPAFFALKQCYQVEHGANDIVTPVSVKLVHLEC